MLSTIQLFLKTRKSRKEAINEKEENQKVESCIAVSHTYRGLVVENSLQTRESQSCC